MKQLSSPPGAPALQAHFQVPQDPPRREESLLLRPRRTQRSPWTAAHRCLLKTATRLAGRVCTSQGNTGQEEDTNYRRTLLSSLLDKQRATGFPRLPDTKWTFAGRCVWEGGHSVNCAAENPQKALNNITKRSRGRKRRKAIKTRSTPGAGDPRPRVGSRPGI